MLEHEHIVRMLLAAEDINVELKDKNGSSARSIASQAGPCEMQQLLEEFMKSRNRKKKHQKESEVRQIKSAAIQYSLL
jgi:hypothetical protein